MALPRAVREASRISGNGQARDASTRKGEFSLCDQTPGRVGSDGWTYSVNHRKQDEDGRPIDISMRGGRIRDALRQI